MAELTGALPGARPSRGADPRGLLVVDKPWGWSSHDVVGMVRRCAGTRAVGHAGTLDPLATGVLVLALGPATRVLDAVMDLPKCYVAEVRLGARSATDDAEGPLLSGGTVPPLDIAALQAVLPAFLGAQEQRPPAFAAIKVDGQPAYAAARRGDEMTLAARPVTVYALALLRLHPPYLTLAVWCSRGTYIRALARDLGERLGCGAYLAGLVRTAVGPFRLREALTLERLEALAGDPRLAEHLQPPEAALAGRPVLVACAQAAEDLSHGRAVGIPGAVPAEATASWALGPDGRLLALGQVLPAAATGDGGAGGGRWQPRRVFGAQA